MASRDVDPNRTITEAADDAESSIQNTIQRLDFAFERIRHLRREILYPEQWDSANGSISRNRLGPGHEAIMLTDQNERVYLEETERMDRMSTIIPADTRERLRQFEVRHPEPDRERWERDRNRDRAHSHLLRAAAAHMHPLDTSISPSSSHPSSAQSPLNFTSLLSPPRQRLLPYRPLDTQPFRRRESSSSLSDDPNTELGRRVAARESAQGIARDSATRNSSQNSNTSSRDSLYRLPTVIERDFEYGTRTRPQRSEPALLRHFDPSLEQLRLEIEGRTSRSLDNTGVPPSPSAEASLLRANVRARAAQSRQSSNVSSSLPSATSSQSRLSLLSNFGVQNLPTPSSTLSNPPLLFEEPTSYVLTSGEDSRLRYIEEERAQAFEENYMSRARTSWDSRAEQDLLFTSSPVQMHNNDTDGTRPGHHRDNTVRVQNHAFPSILSVDANGDEVRPDSIRARQFVESSLGLYSMRRNATDDYPLPQPVPPFTHNSEPDIVSSQNHDPRDVLYHPLIPDGPSSVKYVPFSSAESSLRYFGTNTPRYIDPLPSALVDTILPAQSRRTSVHVSTATMTVMAGR